MIKHLLLFCCAALIFASSKGFAQNYKLEPIADVPSGLPAAYAALIDSKGYRVVGPSGPWCEVWFRKAIPTSAKPADGSIAFPIKQGTMIGILRFPGKGADRRDQTIKAGTYTMRYSNFPVDGAHQGVAPQRDFALLTPVGNDPDPNTTPEFEKLVEQSKTSGTAHAAVFSMEPPTATTFPSLAKEGEHDWALAVKVGDLAMAIIVAGKYEG